MKSFIDRYKPYLPIGVVLVLILIFFVFYKDKPEEESSLITAVSSFSQEENAVNQVYVDIQGQVKNPGVYEFEEGQLVKDVIDKSGGFTENADLEYVSKNINMAQKIQDEDKIYIPAKGEVQDSQDNLSSELLGVGGSVSGKININKATIDELDSLPGIGPSYAQKIIDGRPYKTIEDIKNVKGIGDATFEKIKDQITL